MDIKNLEELIRPYMETHRKKFISYDCKNLLPVGENYGSTMLALNIKAKQENGEEESIHCVAKKLPPQGTAREFFNVSSTYSKEVNHYKTIVPLLNAFCKTRGAKDVSDIFAECLGARLSLNLKSTEIDDDAVLIFTNLTKEGYIIGDRLTGCDLDTTKLVLKNLALMHGVVIAFKLANPKEFKEKIESNLGMGIHFVPTDELMDKIVKDVLKLAALNPNCVPLLDRIDRATRTLKDFYPYCKVRQPYATLVHKDLWTNNILIKYTDGKPTNNVFVDFQVCRYESPAADVLFFLYSSVRMDIIKTKIDELMKFYYDELINVLRKLKCDLTPFTYELFLEDTDVVAKDILFSHLIFMLTPLFTVKGKAKELTEWSPDDLTPDEETLHKNYFERLHFTILDFARRNWL
ncbi:hypothetical protein MML48_5g00005485 [Holotrichia oblita]|uniref:Uncharacterized protein n=1 Tax=Holotrichia oblita TaxID=644536 RepID=A0ACB9T504_HOLOL|nr:hypothetical protein MML48_5g00005485 [Holotrichia oblita]